MASITKHTKSRFFTACYTDRDGRQVKRSTKSTDRNEAMRIACELERVEKQARRSNMTTAQLQRIFSDFSEKVTGDQFEVPSVEIYLNDWLVGVKVRNSPRTLERYKKTIARFLESLGSRKNMAVSSVTPKHIEDFINSRLVDGFAPETVSIDFKTLNTAFRRAESYGTIVKSPVAAVTPPKVRPLERDVFNHEEVQKLINAAPNLDWQTLIILGYFVGARLSDCIELRWENVHPQDGVIVYDQRKTGKTVVVPMHYHVIEHLNYLSTFGTQGYLCPQLAAKGPGGRHGLSESFKRIVRNAGLDVMEVDRKGKRKFCRRTFHSLRHSFNSALANAGVSEELRMKLTGHSSRSIHNRYTHLEVETLKHAMGNIPLFVGNEYKSSKPKEATSSGSSAEDSSSSPQRGS